MLGLGAAHQLIHFPFSSSCNNIRHTLMCMTGNKEEHKRYPLNNGAL